MGRAAKHVTRSADTRITVELNAVRPITLLAGACSWRRSRSLKRIVGFLHLPRARVLRAQRTKSAVREELQRRANERSAIRCSAMLGTAMASPRSREPRFVRQPRPSSTLRGRCREVPRWESQMCFCPLNEHIAYRASAGEDGATRT